MTEIKNLTEKWSKMTVNKQFETAVSIIKGLPKDGKSGKLS